MSVPSGTVPTSSRHRLTAVVPADQVNVSDAPDNVLPGAGEVIEGVPAGGGPSPDAV
jgi:hypothetical protein